MFDTAVLPSYSLSPATEDYAVQAHKSNWQWVIYIGTGGSSSVDYYLTRRSGYRAFTVLLRHKPSPADLSKPYAELMREIKQVFGRTFSRLPVVFGVSRQTLYNWLDGELPKGANQSRIVELLHAAEVFRQHRYTPNSLDLTRTVRSGKTFLDLLADGAEGQSAAEGLVRLIHRGLAAKVRLDAAVTDAKPAALQSSDFGAPAVDEG